MKTILRSRSNEVVIDTEGPVVIIGESINPTRRKKLVETLSQNNFEFAIQLGKSQVEAGADVLEWMMPLCYPPRCWLFSRKWMYHFALIHQIPGPLKPL